MKKLIAFIIISIFCFGCVSKEVHKIKTVKKWDKEIFYYYTDAILEDSDKIFNIETIFSEIESKFNIQLFRTAQQGDYVVTIDINIEPTTVGKVKSPKLNFHPVYKGIGILYFEIFKMFGMRPDYQRPDRDDYVIMHDYLVGYPGFIILDEDQFVYNWHDYDFDRESIMNYHAWFRGILGIDGLVLPWQITKPSNIDYYKMVDVYGKILNK